MAKHPIKSVKKLSDVAKALEKVIVEVDNNSMGFDKAQVMINASRAYVSTLVSIKRYGNLSSDKFK